MRLRWMYLLLVAAVGVAGAAFWMLSAPHTAIAESEAPGFEGGDPEKGRLVFAAGDCASCHATPGQADRLQLGGGLALGSPFGTLYVPNISPDPVDGIGKWRGADLANALLAGVSPGGKHYYPAFPYTSFTRLEHSDVRDLMAYLRTLAPVRGQAPPHDIPFPLSIRRLVGLWKLLYFDRLPIPPDPAKDRTWNRGRYLVEGPTHCAECHSSRNLAGAIKEDTRFAGGRDPEGVGFIPNITPGAIGSWSADDIIRVLADGHTPEGREVGSSMDDVVKNTKMLSDEDRRSIALYIKSLPGRPTPNP
jgi:mono/diheme cytochrome c family protein